MALWGVSVHFSLWVDIIYIFLSLVHDFTLCGANYNLLELLSSNKAADALRLTPFRDKSFICNRFLVI